MVEQSYGMGINSPEFNDFMNFLTSQVQKQYQLDRTDLSQNLAARGISESPYGTQPLQKLSETTAQQKQGIVTNMGWQEYMANRNRQQQLQDVNRERQWNLEDYEKQKQLALQMAETMKPKEPQWWEKLLPAVGTLLGTIAAPGIGTLLGSVAGNAATSSQSVSPALNLLPNSGFGVPDWQKYATTFPKNSIEPYSKSYYPNFVGVK